MAAGEAVASRRCRVQVNGLLQSLERMLAALAPLAQPQFASNLAFDPTSFKSILLEEAKPQGQA
jgi:hypothetical protein